MTTPESTSRLEGVKFNVHTCFQHHPKDQLQKISSALSLPVHLMLFNFDGNMNIAMSVRSAAVLGCSDIWIVGKRKYDARPEVGAKNYIRIHKIDTLDDPLDFFTSNNIQPFLIEQGGTPLETMNFKPYMSNPVCFIMGSESHGIPDSFMKQMRDTPRLTISQYGLVRSLNVSMASSIIMYEYLRQLRQTNPHTD
jgi:tRNA G18 (ribose-2'-O)-methylase SpoU